jgi:hypothetical protein
MSQNSFRSKIKVENTPKKAKSRTLFSWIEEKLDVTKILGQGVPVHLVTPVGFIAFIALLYIGSNHRAENMVRRIEKAQQEVGDLRADVTTLEAEIMLSSMQSEVAKRVEARGLYELNQPPFKIEVKK